MATLYLWYLINFILRSQLNTIIQICTVLYILKIGFVLKAQNFPIENNKFHFGWTLHAKLGKYCLNEQRFQSQRCKILIPLLTMITLHVSDFESHRRLCKFCQSFWMSAAAQEGHGTLPAWPHQGMQRETFTCQQDPQVNNGLCRWG
jgi:hypothetical protein